MRQTVILILLGCSLCATEAFKVIRENRRNWVDSPDEDQAQQGGDQHHQLLREGRL